MEIDEYLLKIQFNFYFFTVKLNEFKKKHIFDLHLKMDFSRFFVKEKGKRGRVNKFGDVIHDGHLI